MPQLARLGEAAEALSAVLTDDAYGACRPGLPDGRAVISGEIALGDIEGYVRSAVEHAAQQSATLILALLGHGFVPGDNPTLYLMARESVENVPNTAVNVPALLEAAADRVGIPGVVALIDTCNAAGAVPSVPALTTGARHGRTRLDLIMASAVQQSATNFRLSTVLAELLRRGVGDTPKLDANALVPLLRARIRGQSLLFHSFDGQATELWLGHNPRVAAASRRYGVYGYAKYEATMRAALPGITVLPTVAEALDRLAALPETPQRLRAERVVRNLFAVLPTVDLIRGPLLRDAVTMGSLQRASPVTLPADLLSSGATEAEVIGYLALNPPVTRSGAAQLVRFVLTLADAAGCDLQAPEIRRWIDELGLMVLANEIIAELREQRATRDLRLIVSLHASLIGDWPEVVKAWVVDGDKDVDGQDLLCDATPEGVAGAVFAAVDWAEGVAEKRALILRHVEVAAPTGMLLQWRPEEIELGIRLGLSHDVVLHWSDRFKQSTEMRHLNRWLRKRLRTEPPPTGRPFDWLDDEDRLEVERLHEDLARRAFGTAVAMGCRPVNREAVLATLLKFTPIVIWLGDDPPAGNPCGDLEAAWKHLPGAFLDAYRQRWRNEPATTLADLRAVWDDETWLEFCNSMQWRRTEEANT